MEVAGDYISGDVTIERNISNTVSNRRGYETLPFSFILLIRSYNQIK